MSNQLKIYLIEDEAIIIEHLKELLQQLGHQVVGYSFEGEKALQELPTLSVDLVLIDIQLKGALDGIDVAHHINQTLQCPFIFISANTDARHLTRAKLTQPVGFIPKPIRINDLKVQIALMGGMEKAASTSLEEVARETQILKEHFFIKDGKIYKKVGFDKVRYIKAYNNYSRIITTEEKIMLSQTLKKLDEKLDRPFLLRIHRSYIVNLNFISQIAPKYVLVDEERIPITPEMHKLLLDRLMVL